MKQPVFFIAGLLLALTITLHADQPAKGSSALNPEIGLIGDIVVKSTQGDEDAEGNDKISVREIELIIGHAVDPFCRFDATITLSDFEDVGIEEAYITHWGLPWEWHVRLGRIRPKVGKATALHRDQLDTADYPLVVQEYLGVEGFSRTGAEFSRLFEGTDALTHELAIGGLEGGNAEGGTVFGESRRRPTAYVHLKNFMDVSDRSSLEIGAAWITGSSNVEDEFNVDVMAVDLTWIHHLDAQRRLKLQAEWMQQDRSEPAVESDHGHGDDADEHGGHDEETDEPELFRMRPSGFYALADMRLSERWGLGLRYDEVEPVNIEGSGDTETAALVYLTFYQSEFARWRLQVQDVDTAEGETDTRVWLQATISIGVHKHALQ